MCCAYWQILCAEPTPHRVLNINHSHTQTHEIAAKIFFFFRRKPSWITACRAQRLRGKGYLWNQIPRWPSRGLQTQPNPLTPPTLAANWLPHRLAARVCWYNSVQRTRHNEQQLWWYKLSAIVLPPAWRRWLKLGLSFFFFVCFLFFPPVLIPRKKRWRLFGRTSSTGRRDVVDAARRPWPLPPLDQSRFFFFLSVCSLFRRGAERPFRQFKLLSQASLQERSRGKKRRKKKFCISVGVWAALWEAKKAVDCWLVLILSQHKQLPLL